MPERTEQMIDTNGVTLRVLVAGEGPAVLLSHGFPELGYSWRHQIQPLAAAGYRVIVPDQRGYGGSSRPDAIEDYDIVHLTDDLAGILDALGEEHAVMVGHDWGSFVVSHMAMMKPERTSGLCEHERAVHAARSDVGRRAAQDGDPRGHVLLHPPLPGGRSRRRGDGARPARHDDASAVRREGRPRANIGVDDGERAEEGRREGLRRRRCRRRPTRCPTGSRRPRSTTTSTSSRAPASPAASTGTATSIATGRSRRSIADAKVEVPGVLHRRQAGPRHRRARLGLRKPDAARLARRNRHRRRRPLGAAGEARRRPTPHSSHFSTATFTESKDTNHAPGMAPQVRCVLRAVPPRRPEPDARLRVRPRPRRVARQVRLRRGVVR